jgi:hypothetical protein
MDRFSTGIIFIRWGIHNRVAIGVIFFKNGKFERFKVDNTLIDRTIKTFIKPVSPAFIKEYTNGIKSYKPTEKYWNDQANQQNGILELHKSNPIVAKEITTKLVNNYCKIFLI